MTLSTVSPYESTRLSSLGSHAVVVGGSMAGLLSARVLADAYDRVTLLERDQFPDTSASRRGVPQDEHVHVMLEPARVVLTDLFPGYQADLRAAGGVVIDAATSMDYYDQGDYLADIDAELPLACASRPLFEHLTRRRLAATDGVDVRDGCHVTDYRADDATTAVTGVVFRDETGDEMRLSADLVVDATGRTSRTHRWLADHGYRSPPVDEVSVDLVYGTVLVERPADTAETYLCVPSPPDPRGGAAVPIEGDRWLVTLFGMHGDHPPTDAEGYVQFAERLALPTLAERLVEQEWLSDDISRYPFPSSVRRRYGDLDRFPENLVVTGDAIASFNPIYGQGMSVAALDALALHHTLADGDHDVGPRFFDRAATHVDTVWQMAVGSDFEFEGTEGPKPIGTSLFNRYVSRLIDTAHDDSRVAEAFARVLRLETDPTSLLRPSIAARVLLPT